MIQSLKLKNFPITFFSIILGMAGFTVVYQKMEDILLFPIIISDYILALTTFIFVVLFFIYLFKFIKFNREVMKEFSNPIKINFFPTFSISLLLLSIAFAPVAPLVAKLLVVIGSTIHLFFTIRIISIWMHHDKFEITHMNPAWFIPAVGNILVPVAGIPYLSIEVLWFFFSIGFIFWIIFLVIFFNRIIFSRVIVDKLLPTLFILIAPPAVAFISLVKLNNGINDFSKSLYYFSLFLLILLISQIKVFYKIKYYLSWWAYSFPLAAINIASLLVFHQTNLEFFRYLSLGLFFSLFILLSILISKTLAAVIRGEICLADD